MSDRAVSKDGAPVLCGDARPVCDCSTSAATEVRRPVASSRARTASLAAVGSSADARATVWRVAPTAERADVADEERALPCSEELEATDVERDETRAPFRAPADARVAVGRAIASPCWFAPSPADEAEAERRGAEAATAERRESASSGCVALTEEDAEADRRIAGAPVADARLGG